MSIEICLSIEGAMQCVLPTQHRGDHRYLFVDDNGITIGALTSAEYDAWRVENAPCARCGMPRAFAPHNQTAAECQATMGTEYGRECANPGEHHPYTAATVE